MSGDRRSQRVLSARVAQAGAAVALLMAVTATAAAASVAREVVFIPPDEDGVLALLLLGSDAGAPPRSWDPQVSNADAFHVVFVAADRQHATVVNIPRDAWGPVAGQGTRRINACLQTGVGSCVATVEARFGIDIDHWLLTTMDAFKQGFQELGGMTVDVARPVYDGGADITATGEQRLTGSQLLTYARDRKHRPDGDLDRTAAQGEVIALAHAALVDGGDIEAVTDAVAVLRRHTFTDLDAASLLRYAFTALALPPGNVDSVTLPGSDGFAGSAAVVFLHDAAFDLMDDAADGRLSDE